MADARVARQRLERQTRDAPPRRGDHPPPVPDVPERAHALGDPGTPAEGPADVPVGEGDSGFQGNVNQLVRYVPTEILGAYVAFVNILAPLAITGCEGNYRSRWVTLTGFAVATPIVQYLIYRARAQGAGESPEKPWAECVIATIAFGAWASAIPNSPLNDVCAWTPEFGTLLAASIAVAIVLVANAFDLGLRPRPVATGGV